MVRKATSKRYIAPAKTPIGPPSRARRAVIKKVDLSPRECWVSGNALEAGVADRFDIKFTHRRVTGLGYRVRFDLDREDAKRLVDIMSELALDISDEHGYSDTRVESIYRDLGRFPEDVRPT